MAKYSGGCEVRMWSTVVVIIPQDIRLYPSLTWKKLRQSGSDKRLG